MIWRMTHRDRRDARVDSLASLPGAAPRRAAPGGAAAPAAAILGPGHPLVVLRGEPGPSVAPTSHAVAAHGRPHRTRSGL
jgi:hypothetical protein